MTAHDEAIEAAVAVLIELDGTPANQAHPLRRMTLEKHAREALEAAIPLIAAQAWDEGWDAMADFDHRQAGPYPTNPYRSGQ